MVTLTPADRAPRGGDLRDAVAQVEGAALVDPAAEAARKRILEFVSSNPEALHRTCMSGHLTGSALVVDDSRERALLLEHVKLGRWLQPGGHADGEGHLGTVALTEAHEETGIEGLVLVSPAVDCDVHVIPARPGEPEHVHLDVRYVVLAPLNAVVSGNHESSALRWATPAELEAMTEDSSLGRLGRAGFELARSIG